MEIVITEEAARKIDEKTAGREGFLKLVYDTEGCGWAVNGVAALWFTGEIDSDEVEINTNNRPIYIEKQKLVFFDEQMKIDFSGSANSFQLKSPQQILNARMSFLIKTDWTKKVSLFLCVLDVGFQKFVHDSFVVIRVLIKGLGMDSIFSDIQHFWALFLLK